MPTLTAGRDSSDSGSPCNSSDFFQQSPFSSFSTNSQDCEAPNTLFKLDTNKSSPAANLAFLSNPSLFSQLGGSAIYSFDWSDTNSDFPTKSQASEASAILYRPIVMVQPEERDHRWELPYLPPPVFWSAFAHAIKFDKYIQAAGLNRAVYPTAFPSTEMIAANSEPVNLKPPKDDPTLKTKRAMAIANARSKRVLHGRSLSWVTSELFADNKLPAPFNRDAITKGNNMWTGPPGMSTFTNIPDLAKDEQTERWFNILSQFLAYVHKLAHFVPDSLRPGKYILVSSITDGSERAFSRAASKKAPAGGLILRKPDIVVVDRAFSKLPSSQATLGWSMLQGLIEVTSDESRSYNDMLANMLEKAANVFEAQLHRRFIIGLIIQGKPPALTFFLVFVDRVGAVVTQPAILSDYNDLDFARIVYALSFADDRTLGMDTRMDIDRFTGKPSKITVGGQIFNIINPIFVSPLLFSRGTKVYIVSDSNAHLHVLKDSWTLSFHEASEIKIIEKISTIVRNDPNLSPRFVALCPYLVAGEDGVDCTDTPRGILPRKFQGRVRHWVVTGPLGDPITTYRSRVELLQAFIDIADRKYYRLSIMAKLTTTSDLWYYAEKCGVVHADVSLTNLLLVRFTENVLQSTPNGSALASELNNSALLLSQSSSAPISVQDSSVQGGSSSVHQG